MCFYISKIALGNARMGSAAELKLFHFKVLAKISRLATDDNFMTPSSYLRPITVRLVTRGSCKERITLVS